MSAARIRSRKRADGSKTHLVVYRRGGRAFPEEYAGTFALLREARTRRDLVGGWLAQGVDPQTMLTAMATPPVKVETIADLLPGYYRSRSDISETSRATIEGYFRNQLLPKFGHLAPDAITTRMVQDWINDKVEGGASASSVRAYQSALAQMLDYCEIDPNPARGRKLRQPVVEESWEIPPTDRQLLAMVERMSARHLLPLAILETTGVRIGELPGWTLGDVDASNPDDPRILSRPEVQKGRRARAGSRRQRRPRWVQIPAWLFALIEATFPPVEDRAPTMQVLPGFSAGGFRKAMDTACARAGIPHFHPHDLRHRRISLWHLQGVPARAIGDRVGQKLVATTLDTYTHSMPAAEITEADWQRILAVAE